MFQALHTMKLAATYTYGEYAMQVCALAGCCQWALCPPHALPPTCLSPSLPGGPACIGGSLAAGRRPR